MRKRNRKDERWWAFSAGGWRRVGFVSLGVLVGLGVAVVNPITESAWAEWGDAATGSLDLPSGAQVDLNAYNEIQSEVTLTMDASSENGKLNASAAETNPDAAADVVKRTATVGLTNTSGYTVKIRGNSTNLTGASTSNTIPSVTTATTLGQMSNAWGWNGSIGDVATDCSLAGTFKQMTTSDQELGSGGAESSATKKVTMCFGARVDGTKAADTYSNTVTLSVVAQPGKVATFDGITQMQQMTPAICKAADINDTAQLEDVRDGKKYWVTKLLDGNCWMSQNLDFDISATNVTTATSDVTSDWTSGSEYPPHDTIKTINETTLASGKSDYTSTYSWDLGSYVLVDPVGLTACTGNSTGLSPCVAQGIVRGVAESNGWKASADPNFYKANGGSPINADAMTYDSHYSVGNYYAWNTATAGTGGTISNYAKASDSVCPKNWKLPDSAYAKDTTMKSGSYSYLLNQYGLASAWDTGTLTGTSNINQNTYDVALSPLFFTRGGYINPNDSNMMQFRGVGQYGRYRSSRVVTANTTAYTFGFYINSLSPSNNGTLDYRYIGQSIRCLVPTT